jgi:uncharacterized protein YndB with AHSA1/START domain
MIQETMIRKEITIKAPIARVWEALVSPEIIKEYLYGTTVISDWKKGSSIRFTGEWEGTPYEDKGTILSFQEQKVFEYSYWSSFSGIEDVPSNYAIVKFEIQQMGEYTQLVLTQRNSPTPQMQEHSDKSWGEILLHITRIVEGKG